MKRCFYTLLVLVVICAFPLAGFAQNNNDRTMAEMMTIIESPRFGDRESTRLRFEFLLNKFDEYCATDKANPADMLTLVHTKLTEMGLGQEESLLALSNTLYRMTGEIVQSASRVKAAAPQCSELWSMYTVLRERGDSAVEASNGVTAVTTGLHSALQ